jgi:hypothetical protein
MNKEQIFRELCYNDQVRDGYFNQIPVDIRMSYVDNGYTNNLLQERDMLIKLIFGEHTEAIEWFLYEWKPGMEVGYDGDMTKIWNIDEYIDFMKKNEGFK